MLLFVCLMGLSADFHVNLVNFFTVFATFAYQLDRSNMGMLSMTVTRPSLDKKGSRAKNKNEMFIMVFHKKMPQPKSFECQRMGFIITYLRCSIVLVLWMTNVLLNSNDPSTDPKFEY